MSNLFTLVGNLLNYLIGTPTGTTTNAVTFADSWVGRIANTIIEDADATTGTGVIFSVVLKEPDRVIS